MNDTAASVAREHELANDRYHLTISDDGTGSSHYGALAITRRVPDRTRETDAFVLYIRDLESGDFWSAGAEPVRAASDAYEAIATAEGVTLVREHNGIRTTLEVALVANTPAEERRLTIENLSGRERRLEVTTYAELVLNTPVADAAHPAFSKLFVQTEWSEAQQALLAMRRLRATDDEPLWVIHTLRSVAGATKLSYETDRMRFIGRGRTTARPTSLDAGAELSGTTGAVLDPILSLRTSVTVAAGASAEIVALLGAGHTREEVLAIVAEREATVSRGRSEGASASLGANAARVASTDRYRPARAPKSTMVANADEELRFFNGFGGFSADGTEYVIRLDATPSGLRWPPMPWSNVIANENAGCIVTGAGAVTSWSANSRENRLTPWFNDPVSDPFGEAIYLRDDDSGVFWSPLPGPTPAPAPYEARHGFGYSTWRHTSHELEQTTTTWFPRHDPVKIVRLKLRSTSLRSRTITVTSYAHLVLGGVPWVTAPERGDVARHGVGRDARDESLARRVLEARGVRGARRSERREQGERDWRSYGVPRAHGERERSGRAARRRPARWAHGRGDSIRAPPSARRSPSRPVPPSRSCSCSVRPKVRCARGRCSRRTRASPPRTSRSTPFAPSGTTHSAASRSRRHRPCSI